MDRFLRGTELTSHHQTGLRMAWKKAFLKVFKHWGGLMDDQRPFIYLVVGAWNRFDGKLHEVTSSLRSIFELSGKHLKICISSSHEEKIENALANHEGLGVLPRVNIHDYTERDIEMYIKQTYQKLTEIPVDEDKTLADVIRDHSKGVFLWVRLVCEDLANRTITRTEMARTSTEKLRSLLNDLRAKYRTGV